MSLAYFGEELCGCTAFALAQLGQPLTDAFAGIGCGGEVEQTLVGCGVLQYSLGLAVDGEDDGALRRLKLLHELNRVIAKRSKRLNVLRNVDPCWHGGASATGILSYLRVWRLASGAAGRGPGSAARSMRGELNGAAALRAILTHALRV